MPYRLLFGFVLIGVICFWPQNAWCWGPVAHTDYAFEALRQVSSYGPAVKALLQKYPMDYLYGTLAADITLGKDYVDYIYNCHNWRVGFLILDDAKEDRQKAAALGYLSHLSVDIISHNYFVPYQSLMSFQGRTLGHIYWEVRFDAKRPKAMWDLLQQVGKERFPHNDELFQRMVKKTIFSFGTNKIIFKSVLNLHKIQRWKRMMEHLHHQSRFPLTEHDIQEYRNLAVTSVVTFLKKLEKAPCVHVDPTGAAKLAYAKENETDLRRLMNKKKITTTQTVNYLRDARHAFRETLYHPGDMPSLIDYI